MPVAERTEETDDGHDGQPHDALADGLLVLGEVEGDEVDEDGCQDCKGVGKEVDGDSDDESVWVRGWLRMKVALIDYLRGSVTPSLCFSEFQTDDQFS